MWRKTYNSVVSSVERLDSNTNVQRTSEFLNRFKRQIIVLEWNQNDPTSGF